MDISFSIPPANFGSSFNEIVFSSNGFAIHDMNKYTSTYIFIKARILALGTYRDHFPGDYWMKEFVLNK